MGRSPVQGYTYIIDAYQSGTSFIVPTLQKPPSAAMARLMIVGGTDVRKLFRDHFIRCGSEGWFGVGNRRDICHFYEAFYITHPFLS
jgi:hypothetical protein